MGVKRPEMGSKWRFFGESATWLITAQPLFRQAIRSRVASRVASDESQERNGRKFHFYIKLRRKPSSPNFCRKPENVAVRSILTPAGWGMLYPARRAAAAAADPDDRGAWNVGGEASGE